MKNFKYLFAPVLAALLLSGCSQTSDTDTAENRAPDIGEIRNICELATLKCTYHNIAKSTKAPGSGPLHIGEKTRKFWIDYQGTVEISFDVDKITMEQNGTDITITLPAPKLTCSVIPESWTADSYIIEPDQWIQKNPITAEDQNKAIDAGQAAMEKQVAENSSLIQTAQLQAEELVENYIQQIGEITGDTYSVTWNVSDGASTEISSGENTSEEDTSSKEDTSS